MENVDCEKLLKEMRECVAKNKGTQPCREIVDRFDKVCKKEQEKEELLKQFLE
jgi:hypothetical protein